MKQEPPKVTAIYQAILTLLNQGQELYQLKVSDITKEAGIGKGTAYEYFSSKEEMIAGALVYDIKQLLLSLEALQEKEEQFEGKLYVILKWIGENICESRTYARMVMVGNGTDPLSRSLQEEIFQMAAGGCGHMAFLDRLILCVQPLSHPPAFPFSSLSSWGTQELLQPGAHVLNVRSP